MTMILKVHWSCKEKNILRNVKAENKGRKQRFMKKVYTSFKWEAKSSRKRGRLVWPCNFEN